MDAVRLLLDHDVSVDDEDNVQRLPYMSCRCVLYWGSTRAGAGLKVTDITLALGGWQKALQCLGSCGRCNAFLEQALFSALFGLLLACTVTRK